ncbi:MAG: alpha-amylase/4-alpha-glucanotransferase domain-containing protein [Candidatus Neomarinimicrobiota bacterium]
MKKVQFIFGIHNHQPVGNFDFVFEEAFRKSYRPFIDVLERHPGISMAIHFSGCLIEWLEVHHPEYLDRIAALVRRGNIEIMAAGFYEPILAIIPDHDKLGQIRKMCDFIERRFAYRARGAWLTERVWEPHLAKPIRETGIEYITVDDYHFLASGKELDDLTGYFNTDEQGYTVGVFPISQRLRYAMPFKDPEATVEILREYATEDGTNVIVMADDGEKFGLWPGTFDSCYGPNQWLERFFRALEKNSDWITTTTFKEYYRNHPPRGLIFLPTISYFEMSEWTLPAEQGQRFTGLVERFGHNGTLEKVRPFLRGGTWRNFQSLYDESNWMQKRMTEVSYRLNAAAANGRLTGPILEQARDDLWRAQCNCAYWHGVFGGLYLPHLRHAIFTHLNAAEAVLDAELGPDCQPRDIDRDGATEYCLQSAAIKIIASTAGGALKEFDLLPQRFNLLNTMRRYPESYHSKIGQVPTGAANSGSIHDQIMTKEAGLEHYLHTDPWPRRMLQDHFLPPGLSVGDLRSVIPEQGDLIGRNFRADLNGAITLTGTGQAFEIPVEVRKIITLVDNTVTVHLELVNRGTRHLAGVYASELNFALLGGHTPDRYYEFDGVRPGDAFLNGEHSLSACRKIAIVNEWDRFRVEIAWPAATDIWCFPVETVSMSEAGFERVYQSSVVMPHWDLALAPGEQLALQFAVTLETL